METIFVYTNIFKINFSLTILEEIDFLWCIILKFPQLLLCSFTNSLTAKFFLMKYLLMFLTLVIGGLLPIQAILNTRLGRQTGGPLMGSLLSFCVGLICLMVLNLGVNTSSVLQLKPASATPWYIWLGGFLGALFVAYITWINQQQGVALTFA